jgi:Xaa-Pro aminopeptidase
MTRSRFPYASRLACVRAGMAAQNLDALVITHPPNLFYLTGFRGSTGALIVEGSACILVVDFRYVTAAREIALEPDLSSMTVVLADRSEDLTLVQQLQARGRQRVGIEAAWMPVLRFNRLSALLAGEAPTPLVSERPCPVLAPTERVVERARLIKDDGEIAILRRASHMLSRVAAEALPALVREGHSEADIAAGIDAALRAAGFQRPAFETIVASGPNSALPHARPGPRRLAAGDPVVLDFGGVYDGYCVDLTRTVQLAPSTAEFRRLFAAVAEAHAAAIAAVRPGTLTADIDHTAREALGRHGLGDAFGHGTGHGLGLEVHEEPRISKADPTRQPVSVEAGMVFTIEPGVYVPGVGGVRIEDDVLVVDGGCDVLTQVGTVQLH